MFRLIQIAPRGHGAYRTAVAIGLAWMTFGGMLVVLGSPVANADPALRRIGLVHAVQSDRIEAGCEARLSDGAPGLAVSAQQALDRIPPRVCIGKVPAQIWVDGDGEGRYYFCKLCDGEATQEEIRRTSYVVNATSGVVEVVPEYSF